MIRRLLIRIWPDLFGYVPEDTEHQGYCASCGANLRRVTLKDGDVRTIHEAR